MNLNEVTPKESLRDPTGQVVQDLIKSRVKTLVDLSSFKRKVAKKYKILCPSNIELLKVYHEMVKNRRAKKSQRIENLLRTRPIRSLSGIVNVSVLTKPYPCPGKCLYCPIENGIPKSYLSGEPAVERAKSLNFDPYSQVKKRIEMLKFGGHPTDKIELRIIGGTWSFYPKKYQAWFITRCLAACNAGLRETKRETTRKIKSLKEEQKINKKAKNRIVGLSIETRPDFINKNEIKRLRELGVTMVELGVQNLYNDVLNLNLRGHGIKETVLATKLLKDAGFKILYQMMPNLPGSDLRRDEKMFKELFSKPDFQPDLLKIYPCALLKEAPLYGLKERLKYKPYKTKELINLIKKIKKKIPYYVRIQRITRDIPSEKITEGPAKITNLRQVIAKEMEKAGWKCHCIRCREVREKYNPKEKAYLFRQDYVASGGREIFLSFGNKKREKLYSLLRLRIPSQVFNKERHFLPVLEGAAIIREMQTFGQLLPISEKGIFPQHRGLGKKLIKEAEKIVKKEFSNSHERIRISRGRKAERALFVCRKMAVISGVGARNYFSKLGYRLKDEYMIKEV